jgi:hypothetical protein
MESFIGGRIYEPHRGRGEEPTRIRISTSRASEEGGQESQSAMYSVPAI